MITTRFLKAKAAKHENCLKSLFSRFRGPSCLRGNFFLFGSTLPWLGILSTLSITDTRRIFQDQCFNLLGRPLSNLKNDLAVIHISKNVGPIAKVSLEHLHGQRVFHMFLNGPFQGTCPVGGIVALTGQKDLGRI